MKKTLASISIKYIFYLAFLGKVVPISLIFLPVEYLTIELKGKDKRIFLGQMLNAEKNIIESF